VNGEAVDATEPPDVHQRLDALEARMDDIERWREEFKIALTQGNDEAGRQLGELRRELRAIKRVVDEIRRLMPGKKNGKH
jgi:hypothetical protein